MGFRRASLARILVGLAIAVMVFGFAGMRLVDGVRSADPAVVTQHLPVLAIATLAFALAPLLLAGAWIVLLEDIVPGHASKRRSLAIAFAYAWPGRYVPGTVPFFAGKVFFGRRLGYPSGPLVLTSAIENVLEVLVSALVGSVLLAASIGWTVGGGVYLLLALLPAGGLCVLHPRILGPLANRCLRALRREPLPDGELPRTRAIAVASVMIAANQILLGGAGFLVVQALSSAGAEDVALIAGAMSLAGVSGILLVLAPAGLGVRDGVLTALLAARISIESAALVAVMLRVISVIADALLVVAALVVDFLARFGVAAGSGRSGGKPAAHGVLRPQSGAAGE
jgi:hypothetical protein